MKNSLKFTDFSKISPDPRTYEGSEEYVLPRCKIGVEIEIEHIDKRVHSNEFPLWDIDREEHSLRNHGLEFVSEPIFGKDISIALEGLFNILKAKGIDYWFTPTCSIHVHMDVADLDQEKLLSLVALYLILEKTLFEFCGESRENSNYCIPLYKTENRIKNLSLLTSNEAARISRGIEKNVKYQAMNLLPIAYQGTIEFRHMCGTDDIDRIKEWINMLLSIKKASYNFDPFDIITFVSNKGTTRFMEEIFGVRLAKVLITPNTETDIYSGIRTAQDFLNHNEMNIHTGEMARARGEEYSPLFLLYTSKQNITLAELKEGKEKPDPNADIYLNIGKKHPWLNIKQPVIVDDVDMDWAEGLEDDGE